MLIKTSMCQEKSSIAICLVELYAISTSLFPSRRVEGNSVGQTPVEPSLIPHSRQEGSGADKGGAKFNYGNILTKSELINIWRSWISWWSEKRGSRRTLNGGGSACPARTFGISAFCWKQWREWECTDAPMKQKTGWKWKCL